MLIYSSNNRLFQVMASVDSGYIISAMTFKRCSSPDILFDSSGYLSEESLQVISEAIGADKVRKHRRRKRYAIAKYGRGNLGKTKTSYKYKLYTDTIPNPKMLIPKLAERDVDSSFHLWQEAMDNAITFEPANDGEEPDFSLRFLPDKHGDGMDFTMDREYAHAPYPNNSFHGEVHYRKKEKWSSSSNVKDNPDSVNFEWVTTHEIGHLLGLQHSLARNSIMKAFYNKTIHNTRPVTLAQDDINGIQFLYGSVNVKCKKGWKGFKDTCYKLEHRSESVSWTAAATQCKSIGATLVSIPDMAKNSFILREVAAGYTPYWIGKKSTSESWENGKNFGEYIPEFSKMGAGKKTRCLRATVMNDLQIWEYVRCSEDTFIQNFVCELPAGGGIDTGAPTVSPSVTTTEGPDDTIKPDDVPCQNKIMGAIRRGEYVYIFGDTHYFKYKFNGRSSPVLVEHPRYFTDDFPDLPESIDAVVNHIRNQKIVTFIATDTVYEWRLESKDSDLRNGALKWIKKLKKVFKTRNYLNGATKFDRNSIFLFAKNGQVGKWTVKNKYEAIKKWNFYDTRSIDAVMPAGNELKDYLIFFEKDHYFYLRKADGKRPKKFKRKIEMDFEQLKLCSIVAPVIEDIDFPDIHPDNALAFEVNDN